MNTQPVDRPLEGRDLVRKIVPFGAPAFAGYLVALLPSSSPKSVDLLAAAGVLLVLCAAAVVFAPWNRMPRRFGALLPLAYIGVVALMRAGVGAPNSTYAPLLLLPLVWLALYGGRHELTLGLAAATTVLFLTGSGSDQGLQHALVAVAVTPILCFTIQRLVTKVRRQAAILEDLAHGDHLTGAANRSAWESMLERELIRAARTGDPVTIGLIDFDKFANFNDRFGPEAGDDVLRGSVAAWRRELRGGDLLGRVDDDGFGVALPACSAEQAHEVFDRLRVATTDLQTCSIGIAEWKTGESPANFLARAEAALSAAKQGGRDRMVVAVQPLDAVAEGGPEADAPLETSLLEQALAESRTLFAELHAVAGAPAFDGVGEPAAADESPEDDADPPGRADDEVAGEQNTHEVAGDAAGSLETDADEEVAVALETDANEDADEDSDDDGTADATLAVVHEPADAVTVDGALDDLVAARSTNEIHKLLRDLSSAR